MRPRQAAPAPAPVLRPSSGSDIRAGRGPKCSRLFYDRRRGCHKGVYLARHTLMYVEGSWMAYQDRDVVWNWLLGLVAEVLQGRDVQRRDGVVGTGVDPGTIHQFGAVCFRI